MADFDLFQRYLSELRTYIAELELAYDPVDQWSLAELEKTAEFLRYNQQWIAGAEQIKAPLQQAFAIIAQHRVFLDEYGLLPDYLDLTLCQKMYSPVMFFPLCENKLQS
ncbi:hypothetical protein [Pectobacterium sp. HCp5_1]|uniref:hypothetical protein n=1 Tax=Pectobacterium sp. HCp5_1 TaxID=3062446 RepID=UPI00293BD733|nr:hypothetical protein [Pectobacterium sp. HCp5_1]